MRYQETWINGPAGEPFQRECASRYGPIRDLVARYKRPFSVFDFGANLGYFSFRIASEFPHATVIAVDNRKGLADLAKANALPNVVVLNQRMSGADLALLARCEAFDVALALNVLHHMEDWSTALQALRALASNVIVETPGPGDSGALRKGDHAGILSRVREMEGQEVGRNAAHTTKGAERLMFRLPMRVGKDLTTQTIDAASRGAPAMRKTIVHMGVTKSQILKDGAVREFVPGINLWNAHLLTQRWPLDGKERIGREIGRLETEGRWHDDLRPWNFILSGDRAVAIDVGNKAWRKEPEPDGLAKCLAML